MNRSLVVGIFVLLTVGGTSSVWLKPDTTSGLETVSRVFVEREAHLMGTRVRLAAWDATRPSGLKRLERALEALERTDAELSTWREDSGITALNRTPIGAPWQASPQVCDVFGVVSSWQRTTEGAFDPAIGRILDRWDIHGRGRIPSAEEFAAARSSSGFGHLEFDPARCTVTRRADVTIDVGAFGKGDALDRAGLVLGDRPWLIDLGGQVSAHGAPPGERGWSIAIAHPLDRAQPHVAVWMREGSLSTSSGSERDLLVGGRRVGHILDPRAGRPAAFRGSVTVWHRRALVADILSTALSVMGPEKGRHWAEARGISACYLVPDNRGRIITVTTPAFRKAVLFSEE